MPAHLLLLLAVICWGLSGVFQKIAIGKLGTPALQLIIGAVMFAVVLCYYWNYARTIKFMQLNQVGLFYAVMSGVVSTVGSIAFLHLMKERDVSSIIGYAACYPLITFVLACLFLGETFTTSRFIGICIVLFGIMILGR